MSFTFQRTDTSLLGRWWWTVDRWTLAALVALMGFGAILILAASPAAGGRIGMDSFALARRQFVFLVPAILVLISVSLLSTRQVRRWPRTSMQRPRRSRALETRTAEAICRRRLATGWHP